MLNKSGKKITAAAVAFAFIGGVGILAASQAYGDESSNVQTATNTNEYASVPLTFSFEDLMQQMENANNNISNGTSNVDNQIMQDSVVNDSEPGVMVDQAIVQYEKDNPGKTITQEGRQKLLKLFYNDEIKHYSTVSSNNLLRNSENTNNNPNSTSNTYSQNLLQQAIESNPNMVVSEGTPNTSVPTVTVQQTETPNVEEPVVQNIETPSTPENVPSASEQQQPQPQPIVEQPVIPENTNEVRVEPLISKAIEDNVAAAAVVTNTEPVIIEKEPTRGAGLFGEDGILAQIVSNPVLRAGIAAFPILIILLIAGLMISRRNEE